MNEQNKESFNLLDWCLGLNRSKICELNLHTTFLGGNFGLGVVKVTTHKNHARLSGRTDCFWTVDQPNALQALLIQNDPSYQAPLAPSPAFSCYPYATQEGRNSMRNAMSWEKKLTLVRKIEPCLNRACDGGDTGWNYVTYTARKKYIRMSCVYLLSLI